MSCLALLVVLAADPTPRTPPVTLRYRIDLTISSHVDLSALGAPPQDQEQSATGYLSITLSDSAGGHAVLAVVDSADLSAGALPVPPDLAASAWGMTFTGFLEPGGRMTGLTASSENPVGAMLHAALGDFFPRAPAGRRAGDRWSDTLTITSRPGGGSLNTTVTTSYTGGPREAFQGVDAERITAAFETVVSGTMETPGGMAGVNGVGSGTGNYYISTAGVFLGGSRTTTQESTISLQTAGVQLPVRSTTVMVVTLLP